MQSLSWDDFRLIKAVADTRSLGGAAELLGLNHSTVFRRLNGLEQQMGTRLFERSRTGYGTTAAGEEMVLLAAKMSEQITDFERRVAGRDIKPSGELRVTTTDSFFSHLISPVCASFSNAFPDIRVDMVTDSRQLNLSRRDADVAVRASQAPPETLVGRRIAVVAWAGFAKRTVPGAKSKRPAKEAGWLALAEPLADIMPARWTYQMVAPERIIMRVNAVGAMIAAISAGIGCGMLPCFAGDTMPGLVRVTEPLVEQASSLWLLTHPDLRHAARVRAFLDFAGKELAKKKKLIEGGEPQPE